MCVELFGDSRGLSTTEYLVVLLSVVLTGILAWSVFNNSTEGSTDDAAFAIRTMEGRAGGGSAVIINGQTDNIGRFQGDQGVSSEFGSLPEGRTASSSETSNSGNSSAGNAFIESVNDSRLISGSVRSRAPVQIVDTNTSWVVTNNWPDDDDVELPFTSTSTSSNPTKAEQHSFADIFDFERPDVSEVNLEEGQWYSYPDIDGEGYLVATEGEGIYYQMNESPPGFPPPDSDHEFPDEYWDLKNGVVLVGQSPLPQGQKGSSFPVMVGQRIVQNSPAFQLAQLVQLGRQQTWNTRGIVATSTQVRDIVKMSFQYSVEVVKMNIDQLSSGSIEERTEVAFRLRLNTIIRGAFENSLDIPGRNSSIRERADFLGDIVSFFLFRGKRSGFGNTKPSQILSAANKSAKGGKGKNIWAELVPSTSEMGNVRINYTFREISRAMRALKNISSAAAKREIRSLIKTLSNGGVLPGDSKGLKKGYLELKGRNGGRVIVKKVSDAMFDIVGVFQGHKLGDKANSSLIQELITAYERSLGKIPRGIR